MASNVLEASCTTDTNTEGTGQDEWADYNLDFQPESLTEVAKQWLRGYLSHKSHSADEETIYQVLRRVAPMLCALQRTEEWWAEFLWQVAIVYRMVPDAVVLNSLYGKIGTPSYVKVTNGFGPTHDWQRKMAVHALSHNMDVSEITLVISEEVLAEIMEPGDAMQEQLPQAKDATGEVAQAETSVESSEGQGETTKNIEEGSATETVAQGSQTDQCQVTPAAEYKRKVLEVSLETSLPNWQLELIDWLADIIEDLRQKGMTAQREQALFQLLAKEDKADWDYVLICALERPSIQRCLTKRDIGEFTKHDIMQIVVDLLAIDMTNSPVSGVGELKRLANIGLGLPMWSEYAKVFGRDWSKEKNTKNLLKQLNEVIGKKTAILSDSLPSTQARKIYRREFTKEYCRVLKYYQRDEKTLTAQVQFSDGEQVTLVLDFADAQKIR